MNLKIFRFAGLCLLPAMLVACASGGGTPHTAEPSSRVEMFSLACRQALGASDLLIAEVPAAGNVVANWIAVQVSRVSPSASAQQLAQVLALAQRPGLMVWGEDAQMTVTTLEVALSMLTPGGGFTRPPVCLAGVQDVPNGLETAASQAGIRLVVPPTR